LLSVRQQAKLNMRFSLLQPRQRLQKNVPTLLAMASHTELDAEGSAAGRRSFAPEFPKVHRAQKDA